MKPLRIAEVFLKAAGAAGLAIGLISCETVNKKEWDVSQGQITRIDERVAMLGKALGAQADLAANLEQTQRAVQTVNGQMEEFNGRVQMLSDRMDRLEKAILEINQTYRTEVGDRFAATNYELKELRRELRSVSLDTLAFIQLMEQKSGVSRKSHKKAVEDAERELQAKPLAEERSTSAKDHAAGIFERASALYSAKRYDEAAEMFADYVRQYPNGNAADSAAFMAGMAYYEGSELDSASESFDMMAERYPYSPKAPEAMIKSAMALLELGRENDGAQRLKALVEKHPSSPEAAQAAEKLSAMEKGRIK
ncbi:MAG: tetratricopeptide repeat protein [Nitrospinae bacterium]|nr:tetratricopeptide repeat protein [Nitrospinota bacterium]